MKRKRISDRLYQTRKLEIAKRYMPQIYPCAKCDSPVVNGGYVCNYCGDSDPSRNAQGHLIAKDFSR